MGNPSADPRRPVEDRILNNQLTYSLLQLRLVGALLMLIVLCRLLVFLFAGLHQGPLEQLSYLGTLANWLPLLPLGLSLYLLGAGRYRMPREQPVILLIHYSLIPLAVLTLVVLPVAILNNLRLGLQLDINSLSFYQRELLGAVRNATAVMLSLLAGGGLVALKLQADAEMRRHHLNATQFFQGYPQRSKPRKR